MMNTKSTSKHKQNRQHYDKGENLRALDEQRPNAPKDGRSGQRRGENDGFLARKLQGMPEAQRKREKDDSASRNRAEIRV